MCRNCRKIVECDLADQLRYVQNGWLKCCGEVMILYGTAEKPTAGDAALDETPPDGIPVL